LIYIPEIKRRIEELRPKWEKGPLNPKDYEEFCRLLNEVVTKNNKA
jgi:hypothetical protein